MTVIYWIVLAAAAGFAAGYLIGYVRGKKGLAEYPRPGDK